MGTGFFVFTLPHMFAGKYMAGKCYYAYRLIPYLYVTAQAAQAVYLYVTYEGGEGMSNVGYFLRVCDS